MSARICLYVVGTPPPPVADRHGDFSPWFEALCADLAVQLTPFDGTSGYLPARQEFDAVVITGSPASLTSPEPWMEAGVELVRECSVRQVPLLGVCFGHQLIAAAFGASVLANPNGWELSSHEVEICPSAVDDPLFASLPRRFAVNSSHRDAVAADTIALGNGLRNLASSDTTEVQVLAAGAHIRGVQFHPEFTGGITRAYLETRRERYAEDGLSSDHVDQLLARADDAPVAQQVFTNFVTEFVLRRRAVD